MPRSSSFTTIDIRRDTRDILRRVSKRTGRTYDEVLRDLLETYERLLDCRTETDRIVHDVILVCGERRISIDAREYRRLRKIIKILPEHEEA